MFAKIAEGQVETFPYSVGQLRRDNPNTSFPKNISDAVLESYNVHRVSNAAIPAFDPKTEKLKADALPSLVNGAWVRGYTVSNLTAEEKTALDAETAESARTERNSRLSETDWWALSDVTMTAEQTAYRQALRDITSHANWPHLDEADWPTKP